MGEDTSSAIRTGITVVLVASLITAVLNLMAIAQNIMSSGLGTLESGVDRITLQEFEKYNQKKVSGTTVKAAISLYQSKDLGIVVRTKACLDGKTSDNAWGYIYGSLLQSASGIKPTKLLDSENNPYYTIGSNVVTQKSGEAYYTAEFWMENGIIQLCNNTRGTTLSGNSQVILDSARYRAFLIKSASGAIVGIYFEQVN